jgi:Zn-finger nucleic acid-binding protein
MILACPSCHADMIHQVEPDIAIDLCSQCGGRFLDKGELNELVTALPGDIEYRSLVWTDMIYAVEGTLPQDQFPLRNCPVCEDQPMKKVGVTCGVDVVMDGCPKCGSFFLDRAELESLNAELSTHSLDKNAEELREYREGFLVRGNKFIGGTTCSGSIAGLAVATVHFQVIVYYPEPLKMGLHIFPEGWLAKIAKVLGLYTGQDIKSIVLPTRSTFR